MTSYIIRRLLALLGTMAAVSIITFVLVEVAPGNVVRNILGQYATPEQEESMKKQMGLDRSPLIRYVSWLVGSDWQAEKVIGKPLREIVISQGTQQNYHQWWAVDTDGNLVQWKVDKQHLLKLVRQADGSTKPVPDDGVWQQAADGSTYFWGLDDANRAVRWVQGSSEIEYRHDWVGWTSSPDAPVEYIPLGKGLIRGDAGISISAKRPVMEILSRRIANSAVLAGLALILGMPLAIILGMIAGLRQGTWVDRVISLLGLITTASPDFATGIVLIMVLALWLRLLPGATVFTTDTAMFTNPKMLIMPVLTVALAEVGYIVRMTRASVTDVANSNYVRTATLKGLSPRRIIFRHVLRNAMMAPVTVIMLHVNWLIGGLVVVESVFGYPGLGSTLLGAAQYKDLPMTEAGTMILVALAVGSQLVADIIYALLNPRIRYT